MFLYISMLKLVSLFIYILARNDSEAAYLAPLLFPLLDAHLGLLQNKKDENGS